jgi:8-oxo-dGTP pyrophosphatase MutT (NUDIX family)
MITSRELLIQELNSYSTKYREESEFIIQFLELLKHARSHYRDHLPGHVTASSWILNPGKTKVFLVHHAKLKKWLQPGGHADGDENVMEVALKEVLEETGLKNLKLLTPSLFDIDIHPIPARGNFPEHLHYDIRFAFETSESDKFSANNESLDIGWRKLDALEDIIEPGSSLRRMMKKTVDL